MSDGAEGGLPVARELGYADAVRLLSGDGAPAAATLRTLDTLATGALLGGAVAVPGLLALIDAKAEVVRLGHEVLARFSGRRGGARVERSQLLAAATEVLVVTAFFETLAVTDLPFRWEALRLTAEDQHRVHGRAVAVPEAVGSPLAPYPRGWLDFHHTGAEADARLAGRFAAMVGPVSWLVRGLAVWDTLDDTERARFDEAVRGVPDRAVTRFRDLMRQLAVDVPEAGVLAGQAEHAATRDAVRGVAAGLTSLEELLRRTASGAAPGERRAELARAHRAGLDRPIANAGEMPAGLMLPTLGEAYVSPRFRAAQVGAQAHRDGRDRLSDEDWWRRAPVQDDLDGFLARYLTAESATAAPLLVLGQPGSGKSVLTKVLAGRLPAGDYLVVRVALRGVPVGSDVQEQVEHGVRATTGYRLDWPALASSAGGAMPVVLLDGFDELLQATGVSQSDYLTRVAEFQRREADQGRPLAVVVTSRLSVADRAPAPARTVAVRLEPFTAAQVEAWSATWNRVNAGYFASTGTRPLDPRAVLAHRDLAGQPLLLLMLALWDADGNPLHRLGTGPAAVAPLRVSELYQRLLDTFARREVTKHRPALAGDDLDRAVEDELRQLSVVAFAMFNRGVQWVGRAALDADLLALGVGAPEPERRDLRPPLRPAERLLGRFFFVHRSRATVDDAHRLESYEFLHATFAEFLVARLTLQVVESTAAVPRAAVTLAAARTAGPAVDDDLMWALLSFAGLTRRTPIVTFLRELADGLDPALRARLGDVVVGLFGPCDLPRPTGRFDAYLPRVLPVPARIAAYGANLLLLGVCLRGEVLGSELFPGAPDLVDAWHARALLWRSQLDLPEGWSSLVEALHIDRLTAADGRRDLRLRLALPPGDAVPGDVPGDVPDVDLRWTYRRDRFGGAARPVVTQVPGHHVTHLRRKAYFSCGNLDDVTHHALAPLAAALPDTFGLLFTGPSGEVSSVAHRVLAALLAPVAVPSPAGRARVYLDAADAVRALAGNAEEETVTAVARLLLDRIATDDEVPADLLDPVVRALVEGTDRGYPVPTGNGARDLG